MNKEDLVKYFINSTKSYINQYEKEGGSLELTFDNWKLLLDYITNLQEENTKLKQPQIFIDTMDMEERYGQELYEDYLKEQLENYKSRIDKAIEYIYENAYDEDKKYAIVDFGETDLDTLLNILKGEDK